MNFLCRSNLCFHQQVDEQIDVISKKLFALNPQTRCSSQGNSDLFFTSPRRTKRSFSLTYFIWWKWALLRCLLFDYCHQCAGRSWGENNKEKRLKRLDEEIFSFGAIKIIKQYSDRRTIRWWWWCVFHFHRLWNLNIKLAQ